MDLSVLILAAGKGTRMRSALPKVLHTLGGRSLVRHVHDTARALAPVDLAVVHGHGAEAVREDLAEEGIRWVLQAEQRGTGHAVGLALQEAPIGDEAVVLVLYGDVPLIRPQTLGPLVEQAAAGTVAVLSVRLDDPFGYGRIVRGDGEAVLRIVEQRDAGVDEQRIDEVNTGILAVRAGTLRGLIERVGCDNSQGEYYLTDIVGLAVDDGIPVRATCVGDPEEVLGVNSRAQLARLERALQRRLAAALMDAGATLADPQRIDVRGELTVGTDVFIDVGCVFEGQVALADGVHIGPYCVVRDCAVASGAHIESHCVLEGASVGAGASVGPFARLRPGAELAESSKAGNFVEIKNAVIGEGSKVNHLSYVGDATLGKRVNVGAGTITCNYDGAYKHRTVLEDDVFIGSNTALVAPITVGRGVTVGAGSTISRDVEPDVLTLTRAEQRTLRDWQRPRKAKGK